MYQYYNDKNRDQKAIALPAKRSENPLKATWTKQEHQTAGRDAPSAPSLWPASKRRRKLQKVPGNTEIVIQHDRKADVRNINEEYAMASDVMRTSDQRKASFQDASDARIDNMRIHYHAAKQADRNAIAHIQGRNPEPGAGLKKYPARETGYGVQPVQFLKPLGFASYLRSPDVKAALREYHAFCDSVSEKDLLNRDVLDRLRERLDAVRAVCDAGDLRHQKLCAQADLEQRICTLLLQFQTGADGMADLVEGLNEEQRNYIRSLYYAGKIVENRESIQTGDYTKEDFSFIERIISAAWDLVENEKSLVERETDLIGSEKETFLKQELKVRGELLIRLHVKRLLDIRDNADAPPALRNVIAQIFQLTQDIPVRVDYGKTTRLMKRDNGPFRPDHPFGPAGSEGERSELEISAERGNETIDTAHGGFLHELTHAAVQRTYRNTPMHLGVPRPAGDAAEGMDGSWSSVSGQYRKTTPENDVEKIRREFGPVYGYRSRTVEILHRLIRGEENALDSPFSKWQLNMLSGKLRYGVENSSLSHYACVLNEISSRNQPEGDRPEGIGSEAKDFFIAVERFFDQEQQRQQLQEQQGQRPQEQIRISGGIFMEYDTVINQMLLWCYDWGIPRDNPLYTALADAAQVEVDRRAQHLDSRAQAGH